MISTPFTAETARTLSERAHAARAAKLDKAFADFDSTLKQNASIGSSNACLHLGLHPSKAEKKVITKRSTELRGRGFEVEVKLNAAPCVIVSW